MTESLFSRCLAFCIYVVHGWIWLNWSCGRGLALLQGLGSFARCFEGTISLRLGRSGRAGPEAIDVVALRILQCHGVMLLRVLALMKVVMDLQRMYEESI